VIPRRDGRVTLLDGGMGTALLERGLPPACVPEEWVVERPQEVATVHASHVRAGSRLLLTCTFNLARLDLASPALDPHAVARKAVALARSARPALVAGAVGATALRKPGGTGPSAAELRERHALAFRALAAAGADLLWAETLLDGVEALSALAAARAAGRPVVATATFREGPGGLEAFDGTPALEMLELLWRNGASAVGANCTDPGPALRRLVAEAAARIPVPLVAKPNAGLPGSPASPAVFARDVTLAVQAGATLVGGCCGAGPAHLAALSAALPAQARG
jgi:5-methyltetrahydrofolate--homocysteine methyltransferase